MSDGAGCAEVYPFKVSFGTSTDELSGGGIRFLPNPAANFVHIEVLKNAFSGRAALRFSNVLGEVVFQTNISTAVTIRTDNWPNGLYLAQLFENGVLKKAEKLIVAH